MTRVKCWLCSSFAPRSFKAVLRHIGVVHARDSNFHVKCGIQGCIRTYNYSSFKKHIYRLHREHLDSVQPDASEISSQEIDLHPETRQNVTLNDDIDGFEFINNDCYSHTEQAALFVLKAKHVHKVSQVALNDLLSDVSTMISDRVKYVESKVRHNFHGSSLPSAVSEIFQHPAIVDPFHGLTTRHLQLKYYRETFGLLVCLTET